MTEQEITDASAAPEKQEEYFPVPNPVERRIVTVVCGNQEISDEQRLRVVRWLEANNIDPKRVSAHKAITIECQVRGDRENGHTIGFTEYYVDAEGHKVLDEKRCDGRQTNECLTYERWVRQETELEPDPSWEGWRLRRSRLDQNKEDR